MRVLKRDGRLVEFERGKLAESLRLAGVSEQDAREVASRIRVLNGISTLALREQVIGVLRGIDRGLAARYYHCRRFTAIPAGEVRPRRVHLHVATLRQSGLNPGATVSAGCDGNSRTMVIEKSNRTGLRQARINQESLDEIGITPGSRLVLRWA